MNGNVYEYCRPPPLPPPPPPPLQSPHTDMSWNQWQARSEEGPTSFVQDFSRPPPPIRANYINKHRMTKSHMYYNNSQGSPRHYSPRQRFNGNHFGPNLQPPPRLQPSCLPPWQRNQNWFKRQRSDSESIEYRMKPIKKKKKLNAPGRKEWTKLDAEKALQLEKDYNKKVKNRSLIIKFPDLELNKEIVSKFHAEIKNVHFQQPSTPRYCFVTLKQSVDPDAVIKALNRQKFGNGYLIAEYKKERDDDQIIQPEDIDPFTLYVGNLAQEVTKDDMVKMYPKSRRIDIGYAMKMKFTRYAFVGFKNLDDCVEAFKETHSMEMRSKSLIVRFRRVHGTVGMPGETKPQNPPRSSTVARRQNARNEIIVEDYETEKTVDSSVSVDSIKEEPKSDESVDIKPIIEQRYISPFMPGSLDAAFAQIKPKIKKEHVQVKTEDVCCKDPTKISFKEHSILQDSEDDHLYGVGFEECIYNVDSDEEEEEDNDENDDEYAPEQVTNFDNLYNSMVNRVNMFNSLKVSK